MTARPEEHTNDSLAGDVSGVSSPERKGRKISPRRKKQLDYKHQMRRGVDDEVLMEKIFASMRRLAQGLIASGTAGS